MIDANSAEASSALKHGLLLPERIGCPPTMIVQYFNITAW
jgi:hypothetical protein